MRTWEDFKKEVKTVAPSLKEDIEEIEAIASIINAIIEKRNRLGYFQRELAVICGLPQSLLQESNHAPSNQKLKHY